MKSVAQLLADLSPEERARALAGFSDDQLDKLGWDWSFWGRPEQHEPPLVMPSGQRWRTWLILSGRGWGKGLILETQIPTPSGWTTMGEVQVGDTVFDEAGRPCRVTAVFDQPELPLYRVGFSDGHELFADGPHQWVTWTHPERKAFLRSAYESDTSRPPRDWPNWRARRHVGQSRNAIPDAVAHEALALVEGGLSVRAACKEAGIGRASLVRRLAGFEPSVGEVVVSGLGPQIRTTEEIRATLRQGKRSDLNHSIPVCGALELPHAALPFDPWLLGYWLGNGDRKDIAICGNLDDADEFLSRGHEVAFLKRGGYGGEHSFTARVPELRAAINMCPDKTVPPIYLRASAPQRLALLQGLMDSDGYCERKGNVEFCSTDEHLADAVVELAISLGQKPIKSEGRARLNGQDYGPKWRVFWSPTIPVFTLSRKAARLASRDGARQQHRNHHRMVASVDPVPTRPTRCITVDSPNSMYLAGRAMIPTHNTRTSSEWVRANVCGPTPLSPGKHHRIALVAETAADARDVLVEGDSGILNVHPRDFRPLYEPSKRRLTWPNGAVATLYNATDPDQLRGPQHEVAACDEVAKWLYAQEAWDNLQFGLRLGSNPRTIITTTPRPIPLLRAIVNDSTTHVTRGSTMDNAGNLAPQFIQALHDKYDGTRIGRQEIEGEILDDSPDSLWRRAKIDEERITRSQGRLIYKGQPFRLPDMQHIIVSIDPAGVSGGKGTVPAGAETGIMVCGLGVDGRGYLIEDCSCGLDPAGWGGRAIAAYDKHDADLIVAETNQGGEMVKHVIRSLRPSVPFKGVHAARGKVTRAEPVAALYEQGKISHLGSFPQLEDQMVVFTPYGMEGGTTGDRVDAMVWGFSRLFAQIINFKGLDKNKGEPTPDRWRQAFQRRERVDESWKTL